MRNDDDWHDDLDAAAGIIAACAIGACVYLLTFLLWSALK